MVSVHGNGHGEGRSCGEPLQKRKDCFLSYPPGSLSPSLLLSPLLPVTSRAPARGARGGGTMRQAGAAVVILLRALPDTHAPSSRGTEMGGRSADLSSRLGFPRERALPEASSSPGPLDLQEAFRLGEGNLRVRLFCCNENLGLRGCLCRQPGRDLFFFLTGQTQEKKAMGHIF